ncbi:MAG: class I SAM-dependent methyltransferase [Actinomycetales bacterium]
MHDPSHHEDGHEHPASGLIHAAREYDLVTNAVLLGQRRRLYASLAQLAAPRAGERVVDIGSGTGALTTAIAERLPPGASVLGIDPSPEMVERATELAAGIPAGESRPTYAQMSAESVDLADETVDLVVSALAVHHIPADVRPRAAREIARVLRPGGRVMIAEFAPMGGEIGARAVSALVGPAMREDRTAEVSGLLREAGLAVIDTRRAAVFFGCVLAVKP